MRLVDMAELGSRIQNDFDTKDARSAAEVLDCLMTGSPRIRAAAKTLAAYARETAEAKYHRALGNIELACRHEARAEKLYERLPRRARW